LRDLERGPQLAGDLALANDHRVEAGGHREDVLDRALFAVDVEIPGQVLQRHARVARHQLGDRGDPGVKPLDVGVDLDPVARRDDDGTTHVRGLVHVAQELVPLIRGDRGALDQRDGGAAVTQPDDEDAHASTWPGGTARRSGGRALMADAPVYAHRGSADI